MTKRSTYMNMSLKDTTFIKRCGLQRVVKCWKTLRLLDAYFWQFWTTSKIGLKIELRYYLNCASSRRSTVYHKLELMSLYNYTVYCDDDSIVSTLTVVNVSRNGRGALYKPLKLLTLKTRKMHLNRPFKVLHSLHLY